MRQFNPRSPLARELAFNFWYEQSNFINYSHKSLRRSVRVGTNAETELLSTGSPVGWAADMSSANLTNARHSLGTVNSSHPVSFVGQTEITLNAWARLSSTGNAQFPRIIDKSTAGSGSGGWYWGATNTNTQMTFASRSGTQYTFSNFFQVDEWHMYSMVFDQPNDTVYAYIDGVLFGSTSSGVANTFSTTTSNAAIGNWNHSTDRHWKGQIVSVSGWNRRLDDGELHRLWNPQTRYELVTPPRRIWAIPAAAGSITGTVGVTEDADTTAQSGAIFSNITGTSAVTEDSEVPALSGTVFSNITGTSAVTEDLDTAAISGTHTPVGIIGTVDALPRGGDVSEASGAVFSYITGTIGDTEDDDIFDGTDGLDPNYFPFSTVGFYNASLIESRLVKTDLIAAELRAAPATQDKHVN